MLTLELALLSTTVLVAAFVQGASGLGFALVLAPVAGLLAPDLMPVTVLVLMVPLNIVVLIRERGALDRRGFGWVTAARIAVTPLGVLVLALMPPDRLGLLIGGVTVVAAVVSLLAPEFAPSRAAYLGAGAVTAVSETATGVAGPPLALIYQHRPAPELRSTLAACFLVGEIASLALLGWQGHADLDDVVQAATLLPALAVGFALSLTIYRRLDGDRLRVAVLAFSLVSGLVLMAS